VIDIIDKHRKNCLWRGNDTRRKGYNLAAWDLVQMPKEKGGLGVIDLSIQNDALLLKQLDKFYRKVDVPWIRLIWKKYYSEDVPHLSREKGSFWWKDILRLNPVFRGIACCIPSKGDTIGLWEDLFAGVVHSHSLPTLFQFAKDPRISLYKLRISDPLIDCFRIPMTRQALNEFIQLRDLIDNFNASTDNSNDGWTYIWGRQSFSSRRYYQFHFSSVSPPRTIPWLWKSKCMPKIKLFTWLLLNDRLNTRNILRRRGKFLEEGYNCVLCLDLIEETMDHLFFFCSSSEARWFAIGISWDEDADIHERILIAKRNFGFPFFMEVVMIGAWCIWNERNDLIFNGKQPCLASWKAQFKDEVLLHFYRIKSSLHPAIRSWLDSL
jgi:hypothetical protein